ncbi:MAG: bifunctional folylpolyglutamate synthase/dihydrofolate synthase [Rikenellaceae bacterium]|nr:bifunctional folylpolyglutamate synthase/dihydrofolate synthase [Rikenellaceae bacterium]MCL2692792.1 bifunctional folylpolyglutamate synthase/dihydrofolate synthase [Rikenellaceae bacterium]
MNYKETLDVLYRMMPDFQNIGADAYKPGLERVTEFLGSVGQPDGAFRSVHVAGTNGKGSTSHMVAAVLQAAGVRTGLYTSPHLRDFRERMRVDGEMIPEQGVMDFARRHLETMCGLRLSFFEATMCMAFDWFAQSGVECAVVETGMGGRLDCTNVLQPLVSVITNIGMDHQKFLGDTLEKIAAEKAGIIKRGVPVVIGERDEATDGVFIEKARQMDAPVVFAQDLFCAESAGCDAFSQTFRVTNLHGGEQFPITLDLLGDYQRRNLVTVLAALSVLRGRMSFGEGVIAGGLRSAAASTGLRGRWETLGRDPLTVCDTGHNTHGLRLVAEQIRAQRYEKLYMVIGMVREKDFDEILPLLPRDAYYIFTAPSNERALPSAELAKLAAPYGLHGEVVETVPDALTRARELASPADMIFIGGSTFTVADIVI